MNNSQALRCKHYHPESKSCEYQDFVCMIFDKQVKVIRCDAEESFTSIAPKKCYKATITITPTEQ